GFLQRDDEPRLIAARDHLLDVRVALHRVTGARSDQLTLQDQDAVAALVGAEDADALVRALAESSRAVVWITSELWSRVESARRGPASRVGGVRTIGDGVRLVDGRVGFEPGVPVDAALALRLSARAAEVGAPVDRDALESLASVEEVTWTR